MPNWTRDPDNPIIRPEPGTWKHDRCTSVTVAFKDGRFVEGKRIEKTEKGYRIHFKNGQIEVAGDLVIVLAYCTVDDKEAQAMHPKVVHVDAENRVLE